MKLDGLIKLPLFIIGSVVMVGFLAVGAIAFFMLTAAEKTPMPADRAAVFTLDDVRQIASDAPFDPARESWEIIRYIDGEWEITYTYDGIDQPEWSMYVNTTTTIAVNPKEARDTYVLLSGLGGLLGPDVETRPADDLLTLGDRHTCSIYLADDGSDGGNTCIVLDENRVVHWTVGGIGFSEPGSLDGVLGPVLERLRSYEPGKVERTP